MGIRAAAAKPGTVLGPESSWGLITPGLWTVHQLGIDGGSFSSALWFDKPGLNQGSVLSLTLQLFLP